jgi:hypothetical protein
MRRRSIFDPDVTSLGDALCYLAKKRDVPLFFAELIVSWEQSFFSATTTTTMRM